MNDLYRAEHHSAWFRYGLAAVTTLLALGIRLWLDPVLGRHSAFAPFTLAVMISAAIGGWGPGAAATLLSGLAATYFWRDPRLSIPAEQTAEAIQFVVFIVIGSGINLFARLIKSAQHEAELSRAEAENANQAKDRFLAMLSHELRTPLNPILLSASAMEHDEAVPEPIRNEISMIRRNIDLETHLVDDLLDVTRISKGKMRMELRTVDAHKVLTETIATVRHEVESKRLALSVRLDAKAHNVSADPARLQQVFWNLIRNASKFTEPGGSITVHSRNGHDQRFVVEITDTGIGIDPNLLPTIFLAFEQGGEKRTRQFGGLGLGLTISKGLVDLHGGKISAASEGLRKGTTMTVELPTTDESVREAVENKPEKPFVTVRILVVEDDKVTAQTMARLLEKRGYHVKTAGTLAEAKKMATQPFDILLSDLSLPDGSGLDLVKDLGRQYKFKSIALSGYGMDSDVQASIAAGFSIHLTKPIDIESLDSSIQRLCGNDSP